MNDKNAGLMIIKCNAKYMSEIQGGAKAAPLVSPGRIGNFDAIFTDW